MWGLLGPLDQGHRSPTRLGLENSAFQPGSSRTMCAETGHGIPLGQGGLGVCPICGVPVCASPWRGRFMLQTRGRPGDELAAGVLGAHRAQGRGSDAPWPTFLPDVRLPLCK